MQFLANILGATQLISIDPNGLWWTLIVSKCARCYKLMHIRISASTLHKLRFMDTVMDASVCVSGIYDCLFSEGALQHLVILDNTWIYLIILALNWSSASGRSEWREGVRSLGKNFELLWTSLNFYYRRKTQKKKHTRADSRKLHNIIC